MKERRERLQKELEHLDKAHRAGIIDDREFNKGRERIERKLLDIDSMIRKDEESSKVISDIITSPKEQAESAVEVVDMPKEEDNYGIIVEDYKKPDASAAGTGRALERDSEKEAGTDDREDMQEPDRMHEDIDEKTEDEADVASAARPKKIRILVRKRSKNHKKARTPEEAEFENEDTGGSLLKPLLAVLALLIVFGGVYALFKYIPGMERGDTNSTVPAFNAMTGKNLTIAVEGVTIPIQVYTDFRCPPCKQMHEQVKRLKAEFGSSIEVVHKNYPLDTNINAAMAAECARQQSMFDAYADKLFGAPTSDAGVLKDYAMQLGLNQAQFNECLDKEATRNAVLNDYREGSAKGVQGTPTLFINGEIAAGFKSYEDLKAIVQQELA